MPSRLSGTQRAEHARQSAGKTWREIDTIFNICLYKDSISSPPRVKAR